MVRWLLKRQIDQLLMKSISFFTMEPSLVARKITIYASSLPQAVQGHQLIVQIDNGSSIFMLGWILWLDRRQIEATRGELSRGCYSDWHSINILFMMSDLDVDIVDGFLEELPRPAPMSRELD